VAKSITATRQEILDCICDSLAEQNRPVCECYATVGVPMVSNCCECELDTTGEVSISLLSVQDVDPNTFSVSARRRPCKGGQVAATFQIVLARCFPTITEEGEVPDTVDQTEAANELDIDITAIWYALTCCLDNDIDRLIESVNVQTEPSGGCSFVSIRVTAAVDMKLSLLDDTV